MNKQTEIEDNILNEPLKLLLDRQRANVYVAKKLDNNTASHIIHKLNPLQIHLDISFCFLKILGFNYCTSWSTFKDLVRKQKVLNQTLADYDMRQLDSENYLGISEVIKKHRLYENSPEVIQVDEELAGLLSWILPICQQYESRSRINILMQNVEEVIFVLLNIE